MKKLVGFLMFMAPLWAALFYAGVRYGPHAVAEVAALALLGVGSMGMCLFGGLILAEQRTMNNEAGQRMARILGEPRGDRVVDEGQ